VVLAAGGRVGERRSEILAPIKFAIAGMRGARERRQQGNVTLAMGVNSFAQSRPVHTYKVRSSYKFDICGSYPFGT
jgi:hypothetical protein